MIQTTSNLYLVTDETGAFRVTLGNVTVAFDHATAQATFRVSEGNADATLQVARKTHRALGALLRQVKAGKLDLSTPTYTLVPAAPEAPEPAVTAPKAKASEAPKAKASEAKASEAPEAKASEAPEAKASEPEPEETTIDISEADDDGEVMVVVG